MSTGRNSWRELSAGRGRGSNLPFRGGLFRGRPSQPPARTVVQSSPPSPPLGPVLTTLNEDDLAKSPDLYEYSTEIIGCEDIASYNWLNEKEPTILVPGKPPAWTPLTTATKLKEDDGTYFRDRNAARYPAHPIEPAVQAIFATQPNFPSTSIDVFACSSTLGNLLRFVRKVDKPFRMLVEVVGDTVFFVRRENSPTELIPGVRGFGHTFPEAYTTWEAAVKRSESHQRILKYELRGLDFLVRFEADGYHKDFVPGGSKVERAPAYAETNDLDDMLSSALDQSTIAAYPPAPDKSLTIIRGGQRIPQSAIFDLKTRSVRKRDQDTLGEEMPRLWVAQIDHFILAYHKSGVFEDIQTRNVRHKVQEWERENEDALGRFAALLRKIVAFARSRSDGKLEVRRRDINVLELRAQSEDVGHTLPPTVEARWAAGPLGGSGDSSDGSQGPYRHPNSEPDDDDDEDDHLDWDEESEGSLKDFTACSADDWVLRPLHLLASRPACLKYLGETFSQKGSKSSECIYGLGVKVFM